MKNPLFENPNAIAVAVVQDFSYEEMERFCEMLRRLTEIQEIDWDTVGGKDVIRCLRKDAEKIRKIIYPFTKSTLKVVDEHGNWIGKADRKS